MPLNKRKIQKIIKKYKKDFEELEHYDKTRERLWHDVLMSRDGCVTIEEAIAKAEKK